MRIYDPGSGGLPVFWLHGTPNTGAPPEPLFADSARLGIRWLGYEWDNLFFASDYFGQLPGEAVDPSGSGELGHQPLDDGSHRGVVERGVDGCVHGPLVGLVLRGPRRPVAGFAHRLDERVLFRLIEPVNKHCHDQRRRLVIRPAAVADALDKDAYFFL